MLWDIIRDFIVEHITGGTIVTANGSVHYYYGHLGLLSNGATDGNATYYNGTTTDIMVPLKVFTNDGEEILNYINFGDWLATTLTIIAMCLIVAFAIWLVRWVFKAVSSAFLLRR